jgi:hypothetical protein
MGLWWQSESCKSIAGSSYEEEAVPFSSAAGSCLLLGTGCKADTQAATRSARRRRNQLAIAMDIRWYGRKNHQNAFDAKKQKNAQYSEKEQ